MSTITINVNADGCDAPTIADVLSAINQLKEIAMATHAEVTAQIEAYATQTDKIISEVQAATAQLVAAIDAAQ
jgi:F0F1-type ATP synthase membrane subunit b/b'